MLKGNPLILMLAVGALSMFGLPKLLAMIDPEIAEEVAQNQRDMHSKLAAFSSMDVGASTLGPSDECELTNRLVAGGLSKALAGSEAGSGASTPQIAASEGKSKKKRK